MVRSIRPVIMTIVSPPPRIARMEICRRTVMRLDKRKKDCGRSTANAAQIRTKKNTVPYRAANFERLLLLRDEFTS